MIYEQHFALQRAPFSMLPDPDFLYLGKQHSSAKAFLESSAFVHDSFVVITGAIGAGKTTLVEGYLSELSPADTIIARVNQTQISPTGFLRLLLDELGLRAFKAKKPELLSRFSKFLGRAAGEGKRLVLVIDEAQNLSHEVLEEVRMLTGGPHAAALSVVLIGQPEFLDTLKTPALRQLAQRCRLRSHIEALPKAECVDYIDHRIVVAGGDPEKLFTKPAKMAVYEATGGVPRLINSLCDTALICAFADGQETVSKKMIVDALRELNWEPPGDYAFGGAEDTARHATVRTEVAAGNRDREDTGRDSADERLQAALSEIEMLRDDLSRTTSQGEALAASHARLDELQTAVDELSGMQGLADDYEQVTADIAELSTALDLADSRVAEHEALIAKLSSRSAPPDDEQNQPGQEQRELARLNTMLQEQAALIESLQAAADEHARSAALDGELQTNLSDQSAANEQLEEQNRQLQSELDNQQAELARLNAAIEEQSALIESLQAAAGEHAKAAAAADDLEKNLSDQSAANEQLQEDIARLQADLAARQEEQERLEAGLAAATAEQDRLAATLADRSASLLGRDNSIETLKTEVRNKSKLIDELHDKLASLRALSDGSADLAEQYEQLGSQLRQEQESGRQKSARVTELEQLLAARDDDATSSEQRCEALQGQLTEITEQRDELDQALRTERESGTRNATLVAELEETCSTQLQTIADLELTQGQQDDKLSEYQQQIDELNELLRARTDAGAEDAARASRLEAEREEQAQRITALEKDAVRIRTDAAEGERKLEALSAELKASLQEKQQLIAEMDALTGKIAARDNTISTVEAEVRGKNRLIDELHDKLAPLPELQEQVQTLSAQNAELSSELETRNERIFELQEALALGQQRLDEARREMEDAHGGQVNLHMEVGELKAEITALQGERQLRDDLVTSLQTECQNRKSDLRKLRKELDESMDQSRELKDSLELGEERIVDLEKQLDAAMETISEMGESSARVNSDMETYERELNEQKEKLASLNQELTVRNSELQSLETSLRQKTETIKILEFDVEASSEAREAEAASLTELRALVAQLRAEIEARDVRIEELLAAQEQSADDADRLRGRIDEQSALMEEMENELARSQNAGANGVDSQREFNETAVLTEENVEADENTAAQRVLEAGLIITSNGHPARRVTLSNERILIGRTGDSDVRIDNEFASRHHAQIVQRDGAYILEDLNSTNGIFVNSRRVSRRQLRNRDVIRIGNDKMIFVLDQHTSH